MRNIFLIKYGVLNSILLQLKSLKTLSNTSNRIPIIIYELVITGGVEQWDKAVADANAEYRTRMHNIFCDNCHSHVAYALNSMEISAFGIRNWDMVKLCFLVFFKGRFLGFGGCVAQFLPFTVLVMIVVLVRAI